MKRRENLNDELEEAKRSARLEKAAPEVLRALQLYVKLDGELADDSIQHSIATEDDRWLECERAAAVALAAAGVELPAWLAEAVSEE